MQSCLLTTHPSLGLELEVQRKEEMKKSRSERIAPVIEYVVNAGSKVGPCCTSYMSYWGNSINNWRKKQE